MRILHTDFHHGWGGQANRILNLSRGLADDGHAVLVAAPGDSELLRRAREAGLETDGAFLFARGLRPRPNLRDLRRMKRLLRDGGFDIVHTHGSQDSWIVAFSNRSIRLPVIRTKHNFLPIREHFANRWLYGKVFDRIICVAQAVADQCAAKPYLDAGRLPVIHSAVDLDRFRKADPDQVGRLRREWGEDRIVIAAMGRLRPEKGHRHLLEAVAGLRGAFPRLLLVCGGAGSLRGELAETVRTLGIDEHVRFLGMRTDVPEILHAADLFAMPSLSEGIATAAIEASVAGLPVVASRVGGIPEVVTDGETGLLTEPGDSADLARALSRLLADSDLRRRLGEAARGKNFDRFTIRSLVEETESIYREVLENRRCKPAPV
jgi:glycosyltransferase involved in cell wall biosynthesis